MIVATLFSALGAYAFSTKVEMRRKKIPTGPLRLIIGTVAYLTSLSMMADLVMSSSNIAQAMGGVTILVIIGSGFGIFFCWLIHCILPSTQSPPRVVNRR